MLKYLRYCASNPEKAALALHEYSWSLWKDGQSAADWYPNLWGRFEAAIAAADLAGIPRTFHIFVTEFGFAHREAPAGSSAMAYLDERNRMTARWPQLKYDASWTLQSGWGKIDNHVNSWMQYDANKEFDEGTQPAKTHKAFGGTLPGAAPIEPELPVVEEEPKTPVQPTKPKEPVRTSELFSLDFTGWGDRDVASDPAKGPAAWYDVGNVQVPIINGRKMNYWEAEGDNRFADGESWNDFAPPEGRYLWADFLPAAEHEMLNDQGRCYHLFAPSRAAWVRYAHKVQLEPGTYRLSLDLWGDWVDYKGKKGKEKKVPKPDKRHAQVELFLADQGQEDWLTPNFMGRSVLTREFQVDSAGEFDVGIGILTAFAKGSGKAANGCFLRAITLEQVETESPEPEKPEPTDVSTGDGQADESAELIELSTLNIPSPENAAVVRLSVSKPVAGGWQVQKSYTERLDAGSRLEVAFLRETPETTTPDKEKKLDRVLGIDISYAQGFEVDFKKAAEAGVRFCFIRAASGKREEDPNFEHNYAHAGKAGLNRGIYYYLYPEASATIGESEDQTPEGQARHFVQLLKDDAELGAVLDVEDKDLTPGEVKRFVDEFQKHDPYKRPIMIYTAAWFWNAGRGFDGPAVEWAAGHPLWVAQYTSKNKPIEPSDTFQVAIPKPWKNCLIHQWTAVGGSVLGHSKEGLDLNYFLGSEDELKEWARTGTVPLSLEPAVTVAKVL
jgi:GH25 family lysozyme M1 (1,4-beta-N-acetylmuramidase)